MVTNLIETGGQDSSSHQSSLSDTAQDSEPNQNATHPASEAAKAVLSGHLEVNGSETTYLGATHWATILENVSDASPSYFIVSLIKLS